MPENDANAGAKKPEIPSVEDRLREMADRGSELGGEGFSADWYNDMEADEPEGLDI